LGCCDLDDGGCRHITNLKRSVTRDQFKFAQRRETNFVSTTPAARSVSIFVDVVVYDVLIHLLDRVGRLAIDCRVVFGR